MLIKLVTIGQDAIVRSAGSSTVASFSVCYTYGFGENKKTQWIKVSLWGERASKSAEYLTKGKQIVAKIDDLHIEEYDGQNGRQSSLTGTLIGFDFVRDGSNKTQEQPQVQEQKPPPQRPPLNIDDDLPF